MKRQSGFTLVEMMITLTILAILLAIGVPSFQKFIQNAQIRTAAESIQAGIQLARTESLRRNARVTFWAVSDLTSGCTRSATGKSWVVSVNDPSSSCNASASDTVAPRVVQTRSGSDGSDSINVSATTTGGGAAANCITFNGFGRVEAACTGGGNPIGQIVLTSPATQTRTLQIRISSGGALRMCNPAITSNSDPAYCG